MNKPSINILNKGPFKLVRSQANKDMFYGNPYGGAMDSYAAQTANKLLNQSADLSVIECSLKSIKLQFNNELKMVITGADMTWRLNDQLIKLGKAIKVKEGQILSGKYASDGLRSYIGFDRSLLSMNETEIQIGRKNKQIKMSEKIIYKLNLNSQLEIHRGPEWNLLNQEGKENMISYEGVISHNQNRMGAFLQGPKIDLEDDFPRASVCTFPGIIQLLPNGQLIVLLKDAQTTGGYPRIAYLDKKNLNRFSQLQPGKKIEWRLIL